MSRKPGKADLSGRTPLRNGEPNPVLWRGFANDLIREIETGELEPGTAVTIGWKTKDWKCSPGTTKKAFDHLCRLGVLLRPSARGQNYRVSGDDSRMRQG